MNSTKTKSDIDVGLCQTCQHVKIIENANQNRFYLCLLSNSNADFHKYPRLPVLTCPGYQSKKRTGGTEEDKS